ncbi:MAG: hypothetical protein ABIH03_03420 [Pseudomonadota bacterium]
MSTAQATAQAPARRTSAQSGDVIVIRSRSGELRAIDSTVRLSTAENTLVKMPFFQKQEDEENGPKVPVFIVAAKGWTRIGASCGIRVVPSNTVIVDGVQQPNGFQHPVTGAIYYRSIAFGYTHLGQLTWAARTVMYNATMANVADMLAKAKQKWNAAYFEVGPYMGEDQHGQLLGSPDKPENSRWLGYRVDQAAVLWVRTDAPDLRKWLGEMLNRQEKAIRTCQTFADRNAIAAHPATPTQTVFHEATGTVRCRCWLPPDGGSVNFDRSLLEIDVEKLLEAGTSADAGGEPVAEDLAKTRPVEELDRTSDGLVDADDGRAADAQGVVLEETGPSSAPQEDMGPAAPEPTPQPPQDKPPPEAPASRGGRDLFEGAAPKEDTSLYGMPLGQMNRDQLLSACTKMETDHLTGAQVHQSRRDSGVADNQSLTELKVMDLRKLLSAYRHKIS